VLKVVRGLAMSLYKVGDKLHFVKARCQSKYFVVVVPPTVCNHIGVFVCPFCYLAHMLWISSRLILDCIRTDVVQY
jgi:hypothetical protein